MDKYYPSAKQTVTLLLRLVCISLLLSIPIFVLLLYKYGNLDTFFEKPFAVALVGIATNLIVITYAVSRIQKKESFSLWKELRKTPSTSVYALSIVSFAMISILCDPIDHLLPPSKIYLEQISGLLNDKLTTFLYILLLGPITEEILFRGIILKSFLKNYHPLKAILLSALFFGLIHFNYSQFISAFIGGCLLGFLYWQTKSVLLTIFVHILNNTASVAFSYWGQDFTLWNEVSSSTLYLGIYLLSGLLLIGSLILIYKRESPPLS